MISEHDLLHDIVETMERKMNAKHIRYNNNEREISDNSSLYTQTILAYLNSLKKDPPIRPRTVHFSKEIKEHEKHFSDDLKEDYEHIVNKLKNGEKLTYHLSRTIFNGCFQDILLNAWGITHIHLSSINVSSKTGMRRNCSGNLLLCIIKENDVFLIDVIEHPDKPEDFVCLDYLEIIYNNSWMNQIGYKKMDFIPMYTLNDLLRDKIYDFTKCCNAPAGFNREYFFPTDNEVVTTGQSITDVVLHNIFEKNIRKIINESSTCEYTAPTESEDNLGTINVEYNDGTKYRYPISKNLDIIGYPQSKN